MLRGRETVRAQSAILYKDNPQALVAFIHNRVFRTDVLFIRTENTVGARSAQVLRKPARTRSRPRGSSIAHG
jgi:hypothetical protein